MKHRRLCLFVAMLLTSLCSFAQFSGSGSGTASDPYLIFNETQLSQLSNFLGQSGVVFSLKKDLDLTNWIAENSPTQGWQPIGVESSPFMGKLLGNGYTISGLSISRSSQSYVGFFGNISGATISDLTLKCGAIKGGARTGVFAGNASSSTLTNVKVEATTISGSSYCGGLIGYTSSTSVTSFYVKLNGVTGTTSVGGAVGYAKGGTIKTGTVVGSSSGSGANVGGAVGWAPSLTLQGVSIDGNVSGATHVGGLVGNITETVTLSASNHKGSVSGTGTVGGIVGGLEAGSSATLTSCKSKGVITSTGDYAGGLIGKSVGACIAGIESSSHFGEINGKNYVGGLIGAILDNSSPPTLNTYHNFDVYILYSGSKTILNSSSSSGYYFVYPHGGSSTSAQVSPNATFSYSDQIVNGTIAERTNINNCTAIGNITGVNYVGGLVGSDNSSGVSYSSPTKKTISQTYTKPEGQKVYIMYDKTGEKYGNQFLYKSFKDITNLQQQTYTKEVSYYEYTRNYSVYSLTNSYYSGDINANRYVGGVVGEKFAGDIKNCYAYGSVFGANWVGGIVGNVSNPSSEYSASLSIKSCAANCPTISATESDASVGRIYGTKRSNTVIGNTGSNEGNLGLTTCKLIKSGVTQTVSDGPQHGQSMGPSLLRLKATYVAKGWNFSSGGDWKILETECFPYKVYQAAPPVISSDLVSGATTISGQSVDGGTVYLKYKDNAPVSTECSGNLWSFTTEALQSGKQVQIYADVEGLTPSYYTTTNVNFPGSGTQEDPYRIYTAEDLQGAAKQGYYKLMNDIDLTAWIAANSPTKGWVPIGLNSGDGTYIDGDNHKVTGLWTNTTDNYTGLFSNYSAGEIKNLNVEVATGKKVKGGSYTGILIGRMTNGTISNCTVKGDVEGSQYVGGIAGYTGSTPLSLLESAGNVKGTSYVGGLTGYATGQTDHCSSSSTVTASGTYVGGLIAYASGSIISSNATATITSTGANAYVGGLAGYITSSVTKSSANTNITASGTGGNVGALVGYTSGGVTLSFSSGTVNVTGSDSQTGGLAGKTQGTIITNCYSTANVSGTKYNAGLVAYALNTTIDKCYAKGDINGVDYGGGVVAQLDGASAVLTNSVAVNNTLSLTASSSWGCRVIGGYKNGAADPEESNYALSTMQVSLNGVAQKKTDDPVEGIAKPAEDLMAAATYQGIGWDFSTIWGIAEGEAQPYLIWETFDPVVMIMLNKDKLQLETGSSEDLTASVMPTSATNKELQWTSSDTRVATVVDGKVTAISAGTAVITAAAKDGSGVTATCNVTVTRAEGSIPGDINGDSDVDVADIVAVIDHVLSVGYNASGDVNGDGSVDVADIVAVIDYVLSYNASSTRALSAEMLRAPLATAQENDFISAAFVTDRISLALNNKSEYTAFQFVLELPENCMLSAATADASRLSEHNIRFRQLEDGRYLVIGYSQDNTSIERHEGTILNLYLAGEYKGGASISDVRFVTPKIETHRLQGLYVDISTAINQVGYYLGGDAGNVYDMQGRLIMTADRFNVEKEKLPTGVYVRNGHKFIVK